jgi:flagellar hook-associated protein 2
MKIEAQSQTRLQNQVKNHNSMVNVYQQLNSKFSTLLTAAQGLNLPSSWQIKAATSSSTNVTASATTAAIPGSLSFVVKSLATAETLGSSGGVASTDSVVASGKFLLGKGAALGIGNVSGTGLTDGAHTIKVTTASTGASQNGTGALANSITFNGTETITADVGGVPKTYTMQAGTYSRSQLAEMITSASGGDLKASLNNDNSLKLTTANEGSVSSLQITGGTALASLNLAAGAASNGTDGVVEVDGVANTVTDIRADGSNTVVLNGSAGTVSASFTGGLRAGTADYKSVDLGDGKLSTVVSAINAANMGVNASAIQVSPGNYKLQLQSATTGSAGRISADLSALSSLGSFNAVSEATDATMQVGTGSGAYTITSSSNTISNVLPGVTLSLTKADPATTVTVSVGGDVDSLSNKVLAMVNSVNDALKFIKDNSTYDQKTTASGYLLGNSTAQRLQQQAFSAMSSLTSSGVSMKSLGLSISKDGTFAFDTAAFKSTYATDPEGVAAVFVEGGTGGSSTNLNPGLAERVAKLAKSATDSIDGSITTALKGENTTIADLQKQIDNWDLRLAQRRKTMVSQFSAMDTAVAGFKSQSTWLAGQISGLMTSYT